MKNPVRHQSSTSDTVHLFPFCYRNRRRQEANLFTCSFGRYWPAGYLLLEALFRVWARPAKN
jgi:hypothetical protein